MKSLPVLQFERPDLCGPCGGKCCKGAPGAYFPQDFGTSPEEIRDAVAKAVRACSVVIDVQVLRPPWIDDDSEIFGYGPCSLLTPTGCSLSHEKRPTQCRSVKPEITKSGRNNCRVQEGHRDYQAAEAWEPYADLLHALSVEK